MSQPSMTEFQAIEVVRNVEREIPLGRIEIALRLMKVKPMRQSTKDKMRTCLAMHLLGLVITTDLFGAVRGIKKTRARYNQAGSLHTLGDKKCLMLKRGKSGQALQWLVSPAFMKQYESTSNIHGWER